MSRDELPLSRLRDTAPCPFVLCSATVGIAHEQRAPGPNAGPHINRVQIHNIEGNEMPWAEGQPCPASLMVLPLNDAAQAALDEYEQMLRNSALKRTQDLLDNARRHRGDPPPEPRPASPRRPDGGARWFRNSDGRGTDYQGYGAPDDRL